MVSTGVPLADTCAVCLSVCLPGYLSVCSSLFVFLLVICLHVLFLSVYPSICSSSRLFLCLSAICLSVFFSPLLPFTLFAHLSDCLFSLSLYLSVCLLVHFSVDMSFFLSISMSACPLISVSILSVCLLVLSSIYLSVCLPACLFLSVCPFQSSWVRKNEIRNKLLAPPSPHTHTHT